MLSWGKGLGKEGARKPPEEAGLNLGVGLWEGGTQVGRDLMGRPSLAQEENQVRLGGLWWWPGRRSGSPASTRWLSSHKGQSLGILVPGVTFHTRALSYQQSGPILAHIHRNYKDQGLTRCRGERLPIPNPLGRLSPSPPACGQHPRESLQAGASLLLPRLCVQQGK